MDIFFFIRLFFSGMLCLIGISFIVRTYKISKSSARPPDDSWPLLGLDPWHYRYHFGPKGPKYRAYYIGIMVTLGGLVGLVGTFYTMK